MEKPKFTKILKDSLPDFGGRRKKLMSALNPKQAAMKKKIVIAQQ